MKSLLRSTFIAAPTDNKDLILRNFMALQEAGLEFDVTEDSVIWTFIQEFVRTYSHVPDIATIQSHFAPLGEDTVVNRVAVLAVLPSYVQGDFLNRLNDRADERRLRAVVEMLKEAGTIVSSGMEIRDGKTKTQLRGPIDAVRYVLDKSHEIVAPTLGARLSGEVTRDGVDFVNEYERVESDPLAGIGQHTGLHQLDVALNGAKRYELWIHAGFTGHAKSSLMLNWAYNQAIWYGHDCLIFSLEMPYQQCRRILYAIHSQHDKFRDIRHKLGLQTDPSASTGLPYIHIRDGTLNDWHPNARTFLMDYVIPDFNGELVVTDGIDPNTGESWAHPRNYGKIHIEVADPGKNDFTMADLRHRAELIYSKTPFAMIFIDHVGLMSPRKWVASTTERLNEIIRDAKRLAMAFNRGQGTAVVALFQINREGFKNAMKMKDKGGTARYDLTHLSYANEAERCVAISGTYIRTPKGFHPIGNISQQLQTVWSATGWKDVHHVFNNGVRRIWDVVTDRGSRLGCTVNHRVRVVHDGQLGWQSVSGLRPGHDYVIGTFGNDYAWPSEVPELPELMIAKYEKANGQQGVPIRVPGAITLELAYLLGAWDGDGKTHPKGIAWTGNRLETRVRDRIRESFHRVFGHPLPMHESPSRPGSFDLVKWSQPIQRWFDGVAGRRAMEVPTCILQAPREIVCAYLQGLFDTDGWVNNQDVVGINMKGACEGFLRQVQMLLTALGIDSDLSNWETFSRKTGKIHPKVLLRVRTQVGRNRFYQDIGFTQTDKHRDPITKRESVKQMYPVPQTFLSAYAKVHPAGSAWTSFPRSFYNAHAKVRKTGLVPRGPVELLVRYASEKGIDGQDIQFLRSLLGLQVMCVDAVEDTGRDEPVMDLEVDGDHEYQTGPLLSHNSADVVTASWIDDDLMKANRIQLQCLKSRDQKPFETCVARMEWPCRRMVTCTDLPMSFAQKDAIGSEIDKVDLKLDS